MAKKERWSEEECEKRYVEGSKLSLEELSGISGVPMGTMKRWARAGKWKAKRDQFQYDLSQQTREKTIQKTSDRLSDELAALAVEHLEAYKMCRKLATFRGRWLLSQMEKVFLPATPHPESSDELSAEFVATVQAEEVQKIDVMMLNVLSLVIDRSVRGERMSAGMEYEDLNKAIAAIEKTGLQVVAKDDSVLAKLVTG